MGTRARTVPVSVVASLAADFDVLGTISGVASSTTSTAATATLARVGAVTSPFVPSPSVATGAGVSTGVAADDGSDRVAA